MSIEKGSADILVRDALQTESPHSLQREEVMKKKP
jgi:hypothetical protein